MSNMSVQAVERAAVILLYLVDHPQASLRDLANAIGCSRTTAHRLLNALAKSGLIAQRHDGRPALGPAVVRLYGAWSRQTELRQVAYPHMLELHEACGETVSLHVRQGDLTVCVEYIESRQPIRWSIGPGEVAPLLRSSSSKLFLAAMSDPDLAEAVARVAPDDPTVQQRLSDELPRIREQGYATSFEERFAGAAGVAAPVRNAHGEMIASLSVAGPIQRLTPDFVEELAPPLRASAQAISAKLGYQADGEECQRMATVASHR